MHFKNLYLRSFRLFLFPLAVAYGALVSIRNFCYQKGWLESVSFNIPIICVGNLSVGGTGKSPMVDYLIGFLKQSYPVATLSRGYKRRTSGYVLAGQTTTAIEIGDEPMQFHLSHPDVAVSVGEKRIEAIPQLLFDRPETKLIVLDDAFQHREIQPGLNILLTDFSNLYTRDFYLPTGDLRDERKSAIRSDIIVVTKCPVDLSQHQRYALMRELNSAPHQQVFFTSIAYETPQHLFSREQRKLSKQSEVLLVSGIANPEPLTHYLHDATKTYDALFFSDHHIYSIDDLATIQERFDRISDPNKMIITTEKDGVRLMKFAERMRAIPIYVLPIRMHFLFNEASLFQDSIRAYPEAFYTMNHG